MALLGNTTVYGTLSGSGIIYGPVGNSTQWSSGYSVALGLSGNSVLTYGNQTISGFKYFANDPSGAGVISAGNILLGQNEGGAYFGRVEITENSWKIKESDFAKNWTLTSTAQDHEDIAMSSDGKYQLIAPSNSNYPSLSADYGKTWSSITSLPSTTWKGAAMSNDGKYQTLIVNGGQIYISSDYGNTWEAKGDFGVAYQCNTMSADGRVQLVGGYHDYLHISLDYGVTWTINQAGDYYNVAMSSDGKMLFAVSSNTALYRSTNFGASWELIYTGSNITSIAVSNNAQIISIIDIGAVKISKNFGITWSYPMSGITAPANRIAMSSDGKFQVAIDSMTYSLYTSINYGNNWEAQWTFPTSTYTKIAMSSDGKIISLVGYSIVATSYTSITTPPVTVSFNNRPNVNGTGVLLIGEDGVSTPTTLTESAGAYNIDYSISNIFLATLAYPSIFTYSNFNNGKSFSLYLKADHTGLAVEHTFPNGTYFDQLGHINKIYTYRGSITQIEMTNTPFGFIGRTHLIDLISDEYSYGSGGGLASNNLLYSLYNI